MEEMYKRTLQEVGSLREQLGECMMTDEHTMLNFHNSHFPPPLSLARFTSDFYTHIHLPSKSV